MEKIKIIHDSVGHTLTIWVSDPKQEYMCEETTDEIVLVKNKQGKVIGFEFLHFKPTDSESSFAVETIVKTGP